ADLDAAHVTPLDPAAAADEREHALGLGATEAAPAHLEGGVARVVARAIFARRARTAFAPELARGGDGRDVARLAGEPVGALGEEVEHQRLRVVRFEQPI